MAAWVPRAWRDRVIIDLMIEGLVEALSWLLALLPATPAPPDVSGAVAAVVSVLSEWFGLANSWIPLADFTVVVAIVVAIRTGFTGFRLLVWVFALIHVGGTT